jgi:hypothetical protein
MKEVLTIQKSAKKLKIKFERMIPNENIIHDSKKKLNLRLMDSIQ